jgi:hypothetical protein
MKVKKAELPEVRIAVRLLFWITRFCMGADVKYNVVTVKCLRYAAKQSSSMTSLSTESEKGATSMTEATRSRKMHHWKWVGYSFVIYIVFYLLPIIGVRDLIGGPTAIFLIGCWALGGVIVLGGIVGYLSKGTALWEPALAGGSVIFCFTMSFYILRAWSYFPNWSAVADVGGSTVGTFLLSLLGAWFGVRLERVFRPRST